MFGIEIDRDLQRDSPRVTCEGCAVWVTSPKPTQRFVSNGRLYSYEGDCVFKKGRISQPCHPHLVRPLYSKRA
jgi:hypothetical protein